MTSTVDAWPVRALGWQGWAISIAYAQPCGPSQAAVQSRAGCFDEEHSSAKSEMHANVIAEYHTVKGWRGWKYSRDLDECD
jgi:hypothetical protein